MGRWNFIPSNKSHSASFNGSASQYVTYPSIPWNLDQGFSISYWAKCTSQVGKYPQIYSQLVAPYYGIGGYLGPTYSSPVQVASYNEQGQCYVFSYAPDDTDGNWHHFVIIYNPTTSPYVVTYVDGASRTYASNTSGSEDGTLPPGTYSNSAPFQIASNQGGNNYYTGLVNNFVFWPTMLTQANAIELYAGGHPIDITTLSFYGSSGFATSPISAWWQFQNNWLDSGPNHYDGTPINSPTFSTDVP